MNQALNFGKAALSSAEVADETDQRILDVARTIFAEFGFRRTTVEDVARRLGLSRVTVYRYFPDKAALFQAVIQREFRVGSREIRERLAALPPAANPVIEGLVLAVRGLREHELIHRLLETEPEWLLLHLTARGGALLQQATASAVAFLRQPQFSDWLRSEDLELAAELLIRVLQSAVILPGGILGSPDEDNLRRAAQYLLKPLLREKGTGRRPGPSGRPTRGSAPDIRR